MTVILGPSGSGKSTLLRTINHPERVDEAFIQIDGEYVGYRRKGDRLYELKERAILKQRTQFGYEHGRASSPEVSSSGSLSPARWRWNLR